MNTPLHTDVPHADRGVLWLAAAVITLGAVVLSLIGYLVVRGQVRDRTAERQRMAICAILANIPGKVPAEIQSARRVFARHPGDCQPRPHLSPTPTPASTRTVLVPGPSSSGATGAPASVSPRPSSTHTHPGSPSHRPTPGPTHSPVPSPSPTSTCDLQHPLRHPLRCLS